MYKNLEDQSLKNKEIKDNLDIFKFFMLTSIVSKEKLQNLDNKKLYEKCLYAYSKISNFKIVIDNCILSVEKKYGRSTFINKNGESIKVDAAIKQLKQQLNK